MLSFLGVTVCPSTNDNHSKKCLTLYDHDIRTILTDGNCVIGFANYNHAYGSNVYNQDRKSQLILANFTVFGASLCQQAVDVKFVYDDFKKPLPSVPKEKSFLMKYVPKVMSKIQNSLCDMNEESGRDYCYWSIARIVKEDLKVIPIRAYNYVHEGIHEHERGRKLYRPWFVSGRNSASNIGIAHIFSHIYNAVQHVDQKGLYYFAKMEINLYKKFLQVLLFFFHR